jgi:hypothetical protein
MARQTRGSKSSEAIVKAKGDAQSVRELGKIAQNDFASGAASTARTVDKYADGAYDKIQDTAEYKEGVDRSQDILSAKREAMKGMTSAEMQMNRGAARQQIAGSTQANMRQIASMQAQMGVAGGTASAQQMQAMMAGQSQQAGMEQNLMMQQRQMQEQGLAGFEGTSNNLAQGQMQAKTFDIGTAGQRLGAIQAGATNFANIASSERQAKIAADASVAAAKASSGGGGGSVLCTVAFHKGYLPEHILAADENYGRTKISEDVLKGYQLWGKPLARLMKRSKLVTKIMLPIIKGWAYHMAYIEGKHDKPNLMGRFLLAVIAPICGIIGKVTKRLRR